MLINCPHCHIFIFIEQQNCNIYRCGIFKSNFNQIPPHLSKSDCDELVKQNLIYGCSKPFRINNNKALICDYI
jgi:hypothetical protein